MHIYTTEDELAIEGTVAELRNIAEYIKRASIGHIKVIEMSKKATAYPYQGLLGKLILDCNGSKIKGSRLPDALNLAYSEEYAEIMASYFEFEAESKNGAHWHFDQYGNELYFDSECIDMVVRIAND